MKVVNYKEVLIVVMDSEKVFSFVWLIPSGAPEL